ncbi:hypothetical protein GOC91_14950 [Sinorhizobium medicae]|uniref:Uncharacterized protein n=1 Tax=Sinorhizobium medicae (strain WSM419) TaxID=366394 RepID=A6UL42_SINMW|nr:hypothetical protein Smed_5631 [Sinorhizobium medicae WSM419]MDX0437844.1 hypothetical protein [Sinorhizobium medicae]MDX0456056.1 hypothetical protein [Sinorhizobium medicae]MDX0481335.1 hypothetical protein [Sinorhizobium medicae]MDX0505741.1 hypothetical protein [Sinorhizobium medicae]
MGALQILFFACLCPKPAARVLVTCIEDPRALLTATVGASGGKGFCRLEAQPKLAAAAFTITVMTITGSLEAAAVPFRDRRQ